MAVSKILLESRSLIKEEMDSLLKGLLAMAAPNGKKLISDIIRNEQFHYIPVQSAKPLLKRIWDVSNFIQNQNIICFDYTRQDKTQVRREVKPVALMFSEFYFYLIAYFAREDKPFPAVFRLDRIANMHTKGECFEIPYRDRFEDGEFRKRVQFMYPGELMRVKFKFCGPSLDAVLDRLPTARVIGYEGEKAIVEAEVFGYGIKMWILSQGEYVEVLEPEVLK